MGVLTKLVVACAAATSFATAHASDFVNATVSAGNFGNFYGSYSSSLTQLAIDQGFKSSAAISSFDRTFNGVDASNNPFAVDFSASANAQVESGTLHAFSQATLLNPVALGSNAPFLTPNGPSGTAQNNSGLPEAFDVTSRARYADTVTLVGPSTATSIRFVLAFDGTTSGSDFSAGDPFVTAGNVDVLARLQQDAGGTDYASSIGIGGRSLFTEDHGTQYSDTDPLFGTYNAGNVSSSLMSDAITLTGNTGSFGFTLSTDVAFRSEAGWDFSSYSGTVDFSHTFKIVSVLGFDANGNQVDLQGVVGSDGTIFKGASVAAVPEPETYALMLAGLGFMAFAAGGRSASAHAARSSSATRQ